MPTPNKDVENWGEMPQFRTLRRMVTLLTATLSIGVLVIAATLIYRIASEPGARAVTALDAADITLPQGAEVIAIGATPSALSVYTRNDMGEERIYVFNPTTGEQVGDVKVSRQ